MRIAIGRLLGLMVCVALGVGCSSKPPLVAVKGTVKLDGKAVAHAHVCFWPEEEGGDPVKKGYGMSITDENGRFVIKDMYGTEGLFPGKYKVTFSLYVDSKGNPIPPNSKANEVYGGAKDIMPKDLQDPRTTPERAEVPRGGLEKDFDLSSR